MRPRGRAGALGLLVNPCLALFFLLLLSSTFPRVARGGSARAPDLIPRAPLFPKAPRKPPRLRYPTATAPPPRGCRGKLFSVLGEAANELVSDAAKQRKRDPKLLEQRFYIDGTLDQPESDLPSPSDGEKFSIAHDWVVRALSLVRSDQQIAAVDPMKGVMSRAPVAMRMLFHLTTVMWNAYAIWAVPASEVQPSPYWNTTWEKEFISVPKGFTLQKAREDSMSHAAYRLMLERYSSNFRALHSIRNMHVSLGHSLKLLQFQEGSDPADVGTRIALAMNQFARTDGGYGLEQFAQNNWFVPLNPPLRLDVEDADYKKIAESREDASHDGVDSPRQIWRPAGSVIPAPNNWQPLQLARYRLDPSCNLMPPNGTSWTQVFRIPGWGRVKPFSLVCPPGMGDCHQRGLWMRPPMDLPLFGSHRYRDEFTKSFEWSAMIDPASNRSILVSPTAAELNPWTGKPYHRREAPFYVWAMQTSKYWADMCIPQTLPGRWLEISFDVTQHAQTRRIIGNIIGDENSEKRQVLDNLGWDIRLYWGITAALHDAGVACFGAVAEYDGIRPISAVRHLANWGQGSDPSGVSYGRGGLQLRPGAVELITNATTADGMQHSHLSSYIGALACRAWNPRSNRVAWILCAEWLPFQHTFGYTDATPAFPSFQSCYSHAAAEYLTLHTGSRFFPGGMKSILRQAFSIENMGELFPDREVVLQFATYKEAAVNADTATWYSGVHTQVDTEAGMAMGSIIGRQAFDLAQKYWRGSVRPDPFSRAPQRHVSEPWIFIIPFAVIATVTALALLVGAIMCCAPSDKGILDMEQFLNPKQRTIWNHGNDVRSGKSSRRRGSTTSTPEFDPKRSGSLRRKQPDWGSPELSASARARSFEKGFAERRGSSASLRGPAPGSVELAPIPGSRPPPPAGVAAVVEDRKPPQKASVAARSFLVGEAVRARLRELAAAPSPQPQSAQSMQGLQGAHNRQRSEQSPAGWSTADENWPPPGSAGISPRIRPRQNPRTPVSDLPGRSPGYSPPLHRSPGRRSPKREPLGKETRGEEFRRESQRESRGEQRPQVRGKPRGLIRGKFKEPEDEGPLSPGTALSPLTSYLNAPEGRSPDLEPLPQSQASSVPRTGRSSPPLQRGSSVGKPSFTSSAPLSGDEEPEDPDTGSESGSVMTSESLRALSELSSPAATRSLSSKEPSPPDDSQSYVTAVQHKLNRPASTASTEFTNAELHLEESFCSDEERPEREERSRTEAERGATVEPLEDEEEELELWDEEELGNLSSPSAWSQGKQATQQNWQGSSTSSGNLPTESAETLKSQSNPPGPRKTFEA